MQVFDLPAQTSLVAIFYDNDGFDLDPTISTFPGDIQRKLDSLHLIMHGSVGVSGHVASRCVIDGGHSVLQLVPNDPKCGYYMHVTDIRKKTHLYYLGKYMQ